MRNWEGEHGRPRANAFLEAKVNLEKKFIVEIDTEDCIL